MNLPPDIISRLKDNFLDQQRVIESLSNLEEQKEELRVIRCILALSESDYDSVDSWVKKANQDYRNIIWYAEYDNRDIRKHDYSKPFTS